MDERLREIRLRLDACREQVDIAYDEWRRAACALNDERNRFHMIGKEMADYISSLLPKDVTLHELVRIADGDVPVPVQEG
jgi:hypothetical protein